MNTQLKVMTVQDENEFSLHMVKFMEDFGFCVIRKQKDGSRVLEYIKEDRPDVVLLDAFMPGVDALGVLKHLRSTSVEKEPVVAVVMPNDNPRFEQELLEAGAHYCFIKPFELGIMAERIVQISGWSQSSITMQTYLHLVQEL